MGCDIHLYTEVKIKGEWYTYGTPNFSRNYTLFSILAGVRGEEKPVAEPKGLPDDMAIITRLAALSWEDDGHSPSWLSLDEIEEVYERFDEVNRRHGWKNHYLEDYVGYLEDSYWNRPLPDWIEDARWVFWFDN